MLIGFSVRTLARLPDWRSNETLNRSAIKYSANSARANCFYGIDIWENVYMKLPKNVDTARRYAVLDSMKPYFEKSIQILPNYSSAQIMRSAIAAEYHKLNNNYDDLIRVFEQINLSGVYEKFILEYLKYINKRVGDLKNASLLEAFYKRMVAYYDMTSKNTTLPGEYKGLLQELQERMKTMQ